MRRTCLFLLCGLMSSGIASSAEGAARCMRDMTLPTCGPWLQHASETAMSISWITQVPCAVALEYREKGMKDWTRLWETIGDKLAYAKDLHAFRMEGLKPATEYEYRLLSSLSRYEQAYPYTQIFVGRETYSFRTFDPELTNYSVFLASDFHGEFGRTCDCFCRRSEVKACDFAVFLGDQVNDNMNQPRYAIVDGYLDAVSRLWGSSKPTVFVRGNHDCWGAPAAQAWVDYHARPDGRSFYAFRKGHVLYVVLDDPHDYDKPGLWQAADAAREVRAVYLERQLAWFRELVGSKDWMSATFRVVLCHYPNRLGVEGLFSSRSGYKPLFNGPNGIHLYLCGHEHYASSSLPGEAGCYHNARNEGTNAKPRVFNASDGSYDFTEVCGDVFGGMLLEVAADKLTVRLLDRNPAASDLDRVEIHPDKTAKRFPCP